MVYEGFELSKAMNLQTAILLGFCQFLACIPLFMWYNRAILMWNMKK